MASLSSSDSTYGNTDSSSGWHTNAAHSLCVPRVQTAQGRTWSVFYIYIYIYINMIMFLFFSFLSFFFAYFTYQFLFRFSPRATVLVFVFFIWFRIDFTMRPICCCVGFAWSYLTRFFFGFQDFFSPHESRLRQGRVATAGCYPGLPVSFFSFFLGLLCDAQFGDGFPQGLF